MQLNNLTRGEKRELHLTLYEREISILDDLRSKYNCSRAAVIGAMIAEMAENDLSARIPSDRVRRPGAGRPKAKKRRFDPYDF